MDLLKSGSIAGGIAFLIALIIVARNAGPMSNAAQGFAKAGATIIGTLQGNSNLG